MQYIQREPVAIIGIGCRFPKASNPQEFWDLLFQGKDAISEVPDHRWNIERLYDPDPGHPGKMMSRWGGFLDTIDQFDWHAFRMLPREVLHMDPQQRLLLEVAWEALEDAGLPFAEVAGTKASVSIGIGWSDYLRLQTRNWSQIDGYTAMGNASCFAANRLSYFFNLRGPSVSLDAGCSSSLTSLYLACQNLWTGEADLALAGGVNLLLSPDSMIMVSKAGLLSPEGRCKTLDAHADGFVRGEGAGILVLKLLSQVHPSDRVYALVRGISVSHNGHNEWIIASSQAAQEALLHDAYEKASVNPAEVGYVELHGTGFQRGDPIEVKALGSVLGIHQQRNSPCFIGSVKTNIGHLEAAAGVASIIKVALSLYHRAIPPLLNLQTLHPDISLHDLHLAVPQTATAWPDAEKAPLAGVTTLAFTGANAHAVLAGYTPSTAGVSSRPETRQTHYSLPLSARSKDALYAHVAAVRDFLNAQVPQAPFSWRDICYTASVRRTHYEYRLAITACSAQDAADTLHALIQKRSSAHIEACKNPPHHKLLFLFAHHHRPCSIPDYEFFAKQDAFRATLNECDQLLNQFTTLSLLEDLKNGIISKKNEKSFLQYFVLQISLMALWRSWGITPDSVIGEGIGELAAAYSCGAIALKDALRILLFTEEDNASQTDPVDFIKEGSFFLTKTPIYSISMGHLNKTEHFLSSHWKEQLTSPSLSVPVTDALLEDGYDVFVEMGFPSVLSGAVFARLQAQGRHGTLLSSLHANREASRVSAEVANTLYTLGYTIYWPAFYNSEECHLVSLPTYPWQRERLWPDWLTVEEISTPPEERSAFLPREPASLRAKTIKTSDRSIEDILVEIWAGVLGLDQVSSQESFFEAGGHSLLAIQLLADIQKILHVTISLSDLFQAPTPAACASLIAEIKVRQTGLKATYSQLPLLEIDLDKRYYPFPTTDMQQAYWVGRNVSFEIGNVGNHAYIEVEALNLDLDRFTSSVQRLIERHDMLRAVLLPDGEQQVLEHVPPFEFEIDDLRELDLEARNDRLTHTRFTMDHQILPVEQWPAFEIRVSLLDNNLARLHLSIESLFIDAWSMNILVQEFIRLYYEPALPLPPLELSFRDYLLAEATLHNSEFYQRSQRYWLERLSSLPSAPDLPLASNAGLQIQPRFVHREARLDAEHWLRLKALAARAELTPSSLLLTAFAEVLAMWSKVPYFSINLSTFNRLPLHPQVNSIVGDFTSLLVLAVDNTGLTSFEQRAKRLQKQLWKDLDHSYYSGIRVLRELAKIQRGVTRAIMPVVFTSLLIQDTASPFPPPWQDVVYCVSQTPQVWLDHQVLETGGELVFHWQSVDAIFPENLIDAMFHAYCQLLQRLATTEEIWHEPLRHITPAQQLELIAKVNATEVPLSEKLLHTFFIDQALLSPEKSAVIASSRTLTYKEIYNGMLQLGYQLREWGASPNQLVAVVMEKGWEQVVAVLGVLQSGSAYLPIDARLPLERVTYLLEHGEVSIVLTQSWIDRKIQWPEHLKHICVDDLNLDKADLAPLVSVQKPDDLAYVIYTSGSTGFPKGVMIDHRGAVNTILDINHRFGVNKHDRVLALSALNFDLSVYDIFGTLAAGGTIVLPAEGSIRNPDSWLEILVRAGVTIWNSVPALLQIFVEYSEAQPDVLRQHRLRLALLSGDWIPVSLPDRLRKLCPEIEIISMGGATEASIWSILYSITSVDPSWKSIPYGKPMFNQRFFVLNEALEPCPTWVPGQLYIGGIGLARGYWHDEAKTQVSFFHHPVTGERLYRTGDLGRYLPDGNIEFLGREDFQVKILGHRIELGEIEETLLRFPAVQAAVATAQSETPGGEKRLVAYVVLQTELHPSPDAPQAAILPEELPKSYTLQQLQKQTHNPEQNENAAHDVLQRLELQFGQANLRKDIGSSITELLPPIHESSRLEKYKQRLSYRRFLSPSISFEQMSNFLGVLRQIELEGLPKYLYPSAGGIYPVQIYLFIKPGCVEGMNGGTYYYNPQSHQLVLLASDVQLDQSIHAAINRPIFQQSAFSLFLIGDLALMSASYGEAARDFCLLEAGYISQLLVTSAPEQSIGLCPIGGLDFISLRGLFALKESHILLHSLLGGSVDAAVSTGWSFLPENHASFSSASPAPAHTSASIVNTLRNFLREKLPDYMLPSVIMLLDALPLTPNGKVDRKNLPLPAMPGSDRKKGYVAPQSEIEQSIVTVWQEMLCTKNVGIHDNFFDLGGNSLLMVRVYTKLRQMLNRDVSIVEMFFQYPTIHLLAEYLTREKTPSSEHRLPEYASSRATDHQGSILQQRLTRLEHRAKERGEDDASV